MKFKTPLFAASALTCLLSLTALTGCDKESDPSPIYPDNFDFKQELRVEQWSDGTTNAFADFIAVNTAGIEVSVKLPSKASITANGTKLTYAEPDAKDPYSYAYSATIPGTPSTVSFTFNRTSSLALVNSISLTTVPMIKLPAGSTVNNNQNYTYTASQDATTGVFIRIFLIRTDGTDMGKTYEATLFGDKYYFSGVPQGTYILRSMATRTVDYLVQPNGNAGGSISASKVYEIKPVTVN